METMILSCESNARVLYHEADSLHRNTPGQMRMLDEQPWKDQTRYQSLDYKGWYFRDGEITEDVEGWGVKRGGFWKGTDRLMFYSVDEAGHLSAYHQPEAVGAIVRSWLDEY